jgi:hypothetical protein
MAPSFAEKLGMPLEKVRKVLKIAKEPISLETPIRDEGDSPESLPPASTPRAERRSQHERLLPHGSFRPPQPAGNLPRRDFLGQRLQLADITLGPLAPLSCSHRNNLRKMVTPSNIVLPRR